MKQFFVDRCVFLFFKFPDVFFRWGIFLERRSVVGYKFAPSGTRWSHHHTRGHGTTPGGMMTPKQTSSPREAVAI